MKFAHSLWLALAISTVAAPAWSADEDQHKAHHPAGTASAPATNAIPGETRPDMARMDSQMKAMHEMHDKMTAAKAPAERDALTPEHTKIIQVGMATMNGMGCAKGDMAARHQTIETRHGNGAGDDADDDESSARCAGEVTGVLT